MAGYSQMPIVMRSPFSLLGRSGGVRVAHHNTRVLVLVALRDCLSAKSPEIYPQPNGHERYYGRTMKAVESPRCAKSCFPYRQQPLGYRKTGKARMRGNSSICIFFACGKWQGVKFIGLQTFLFPMSGIGASNDHWRKYKFPNGIFLLA